MDVGFEVVIVVVDVLVTVEEAQGVLLGEFPVDAYVEADLLDVPGVEELGIGIGGEGEALLVVLYLQTAAEHVLALAAIALGLAVEGIVEDAPALIDGLLGAVGVLPALAQREAEVAKKLLIEGKRQVEAVTRAPIVDILLGIACIGITVDHLVVGGIEIGGALVVVVEVGIACGGLEPLGYLIVDTEAEGPAIDGLRIVAGAQFAFEAGAPVLGEFLLGLKGEVEPEIIALGSSG